MGEGGGDDSSVPLKAARCTEGTGRCSRDNLKARQVEVGGRPLSGQFQLQLAAISGPLAGGVVVLQSRHLSESRRPWGMGGAMHRVWLCEHGHWEGV